MAALTCYFRAFRSGVFHIYAGKSASFFFFSFFFNDAVITEECEAGGQPDEDHLRVFLIYLFIYLLRSVEIAEDEAQYLLFTVVIVWIM